MYKNVLQSINDIAIWPVISFVIFFAFFLGLLVYVLLVDKKFMRFSVSTPMQVPGTDRAWRLLWEMDQSYRLTDEPKDNIPPPKTCYAFAPMLTTNMLLSESAAGNAEFGTTRCP